MKIYSFCRATQKKGQWIKGKTWAQDWKRVFGERGLEDHENRKYEAIPKEMVFWNMAKNTLDGAPTLYLYATNVYLAYFYHMVETKTRFYTNNSHLKRQNKKEVAACNLKDDSNNKYSSYSFDKKYRKWETFALGDWPSSQLNTDTICSTSSWYQRTYVIHQLLFYLFAVPPGGLKPGFYIIQHFRSQQNMVCRTTSSSKKV